MGGGTTLSLINFILALYMLYLSYRLYDSSKERGYLSLALITTGVYVYLEFVAFRIPSYYPIIFRMESAMYIFSSYFFYRSFCSLRKKFSYVAFILLILMLLYVSVAPLISGVKICDYYFVEYYVHGWGEFVFAFFYFYILLFVLESRKIITNIEGELNIKIRNYVITVILTVSIAAISRYITLVYSLPHVDTIILAIGYTNLYFLFRRH